MNKRRERTRFNFNDFYQREFDCSSISSYTEKMRRIHVALQDKFWLVERLDAGVAFRKERE